MTDPAGLRPDDAPSELGPYRITGRLGSGGMGVVYRAHHATTGAPAAVKTLRVPSAAMQGAIRREVQMLRLLPHPGIVRILDEGVVDGIPWYAMELLEGATLGARAVELRSAGDPAAAVQEVVTLAARLCIPLAYLHGEGVVHRDLKPDNVLVRPGPQGGRPVIIDFGLTLRFPTLSGRESMELVGLSSGSLAFMSPEQLQGDLLDARSDLFALGCILHWSLAGKAPFRTVEEICDEALAAPLLSTLAPAIPAELDALVAHLLAKERRARMGSAEEVAARLQELGARDDPGVPGSTAPRPRPYLYRPRLAGRDELVTPLLRHVSGALGSGRGAAILVSGESGIGKTRLVLEIARRLAPGRRLYLSECAPGSEQEPLAAWRPLLREVAEGCADGTLPEAILEGRGKLLAGHEPSILGLASVAAEPEPPELPPEESRRRLLGALAETLLALARTAPRLLVLDDLQWTDSLSLGLVETLAARLETEGAPLVLFGTHRPAEPGTPLAELAKRPGVRLLPLTRLADDALPAIVGDLMATDEPPPRLLVHLRERSEGNPYFVAEYLRQAVDEGLLERDRRGRWTLSSAAAEQPLQLPTSVGELAARRIETLGGPTRELARAAAVVGRESPFTLLTSMLPMPQERLLAALVELRRRHVLEEQSPGELRFTHDRIREAALGAIPERELPELHRRAAEGIAAGRGTDELALPGSLGRHWELAGDSGRARDCYRRGAVIARDRHGLPEAAALYRALLALPGGAPLDDAWARFELGRVERHLGQTEQAEGDLRAAVEAARAGPDPRLQGLASWQLGLLLDDRGRIEEAAAALMEGRALLDAHGLELEASLCASNLSYLMASRGEVAAGLELGASALAIQRRLGAWSAAAQTLNRMALGKLIADAIDDARALAEEALAELRVHAADRHAEGIVLRTLGSIRWKQGDLDAAHALLLEALAAHRDAADLRSETITVMNLAGLCGTMQRFEEAEQLYEQALAVQRAAGNRRAVAEATTNRAALLVQVGRMDEAEAMLLDALAIHRESRSSLYEGHTLVSLALIRRRKGDLDACGRYQEQARAIFDALDNRLGRLIVVNNHAFLELALGHDPADVLRRAELEMRRVDPSLEVLSWMPTLSETVAASLAGEKLHQGERVSLLPHLLRERLGLA